MGKNLDGIHRRVQFEGVVKVTPPADVEERLGRFILHEILNLRGHISVTDKHFPVVADRIDALFEVESCQVQLMVAIATVFAPEKGKDIFLAYQFLKPS